MTAEAPQTSTTGGRLEFLDALRGVAALSVAFAHGAEKTIGGFAHFDAHVFRFGQFGVAVFFLCSGFIIPASLERHGSLGRFWISRAFRLFPLYWLAIGAALVLSALGAYALPSGFDPVAWLLNLTMMQAFVGQPLAIGLTWTLAFEMGFYLIMSGLFLVGAQRRSFPLAGGLVALALALALHSDGRSAALSAPPLLVVAAAGLAIAWGLSPRRLALLALVAVLAAPLLFNGYYAPWNCILLYATLFTGTVVYRWVDGELDGRLAGLLFGAATIAAAVVCALAADRTSYVATFAVAYLVFGAAVLLRGREFPRAALRLGWVSYSLYLLHPLVFGVIGEGLDEAPATRALMLVGGLAISVALSFAAYRLVERPMIDRGHGLARRYAAWRAAGGTLRSASSAGARPAAEPAPRS